MSILRLLFGYVFFIIVVDQEDLNVMQLVSQTLGKHAPSYDQDTNMCLYALSIFIKSGHIGDPFLVFELPFMISSSLGLFSLNNWSTYLANFRSNSFVGKKCHFLHAIDTKFGQTCYECDFYPIS
ncbi:unnamed protein product [Cuscuta europaea]|uniref:Uncharacterized protein n=1 Tax=Cuscuta europaea TaxID=41803 RepID=A0A9P0YNC7_CUSEU|nr:unnamed protein product [Cuscuta europaea]